MSFITVVPAPRSTNALAFPVNGLTIPANANSATVQFDMPIQAEREDVGQHLDYGIEISTNAGTTWKPYLQGGWNGGIFSGKNSTVPSPPPAATLAADFFQSFAGHKARVAVKLTKPMTLGGTISSTVV